MLITHFVSFQQDAISYGRAIVSEQITKLAKVFLTAKKYLGLMEASLMKDSRAKMAVKK